MIALILTIRAFFRAIRKGLKDPEFRLILLAVVLLLTFVTIFYANVEGWTYLDSLYFSVVTLATVGYGDFTPHTTVGKIFTMFYILFGIGVLVSFVNVLARNILKRTPPTEEDSHQKTD